MRTIPIIDIFAGPGGLGEGFSSFSSQKLRFKIALSIEKDEAAHQTLQLRAFYRQFPKDEVPDEYYKYLEGKIEKEILFEAYPKQFKAASKEAWLHTLEHGDIDQVKKRAKEALSKFDCSHSVLIGGPPCQAYSIAGRSRLYGETKKLQSDDKNYLYRHYLRLVAHLTPAVFVMENVKGMLTASADNRPIFKRILNDLESPGQAVKELDKLARRPTTKEYDIYSLVLAQETIDDGEGKHVNPLRPQDYIIRAEDYGIPQRRHRVILLGVRKDLDPEIMTRLVSETQVNAIDVLGDLPKIRSGITRTKKTWDSWIKALRDGLQTGQFDGSDKKVKEVIESRLKQIEEEELPLGKKIIVRDRRLRPRKLADWYLDPKLNVVLGHEAKNHMKSDLWRYLFASCFAEVHKRSPLIAEYPVNLLPNHQNIDLEDITKTRFTDRFKVQVANKPPSTVTSHLSQDGHFFIHHDPSQCRAWSIREAARIQTFPDNYHFEGNKTERYQQVGNAVPPLLANKIANVVAEYVQKILEGKKE